jgi:hypothetical protein
MGANARHPGATPGGRDANRDICNSVPRETATPVSVLACVSYQRCFSLLKKHYVGEITGQRKALMTKRLQWQCETLQQFLFTYA